MNCFQDAICELKYEFWDVFWNTGRKDKSPLQLKNPFLDEKIINVDVFSTHFPINPKYLIKRNILSWIRNPRKNINEIKLIPFFFLTANTRPIMRNHLWQVLTCSSNLRFKLFFKMWPGLELLLETKMKIDQKYEK